jgi:microcystin-dependent protein
LDVLGISSFKGGTTIDNLNVTGVTTTRNLAVTGVSTIGFVTGTSAFFTGIVTATKFVGELNVSQLYVTGISTFLQKVNINSDLGVTGLTTTQNLQVYQSTTLNRLNATGLSTFTTVDINGGEIDVNRIGTQNLNVSGIGTFSSQVNINNLSVTGVGTFDNIKIYDNNIETTIGNLILDSSAGTTQINDAVYVNDITQSTSKDTGSIITEGGVGIEKDLYVGGPVNLATSGGITTTGGDLYVRGDLYVSNDIFYDELFARNGYFTGITSTKDLNVTGIATIATLGISGLTTTRNLIVSGISTFNGLVDANAGATIDNIQIGISGDNEIDTSTGNLILDSFGGTVEITDQLIVSGVSTFQGNVTLGDANTDKVSFGATVDSNIIPSGTTRDLGSVANKWNNIYANNFVGTITGNADTATKLATPREIDISGDVIGVGIGTTFDGSQNVTILTVLSTTGVSSATYGSATTVPQIAVDTKGRITSASNVNIDFSKASYADNAGISTNLKGGIASQIPYQSAANTTTFIPNGTLGQLLQSNGTSAPSWVTATDLTVSKASYADNAGISTNLKGGTTGSIPYQTAANTTTFLADPNVNGRILTWNDITNAPIWSDPTAISVGTASSLNVTTDTSSSPRYLVLSSTTSGITTALVDSDITYTPSTDLLTVSKIKPTQIQDTGGGTGNSNYVLTANGSGGWSWSSVTGGGSPAIGGITIQEEGSTVGTQLGITTVNFVGASVTATSPSAGTANITVTAASNVTVTQTGYGCTNPISVTGGSNIGIASTSNAYGRRFIQTVEPTGVCDGDIWYDISGGTTGDNTPAGTVIYYAASSAPTGYLKANGATISRSTYSNLFAGIGTVFGNGDGSTTFGIPDLRNKFAVGSESLYALAATGGSADATLVSHSHTGTTGNDSPDHSHQVTIEYDQSGGSGFPKPLPGGNRYPSSTITTSGASIRHQHNFTTSAEGASATNANLPPYLALLPCIKY